MVNLDSLFKQQNLKSARYPVDFVKRENNMIHNLITVLGFKCWTIKVWMLQK